MPRTGREPDAGLVSVDELGTVLGVEARVVTEYFELGLVRPASGTERPSLTPSEVPRPSPAGLSRGLRLGRELELHAAAAAMLVELLEERDDLRRRLVCLERLLGGGA